MRRNRLFVVLSLIIILSMLLPACGTKSKKTLQVWIQWGDNPTQLQELFDKYATDNGVKVEVTAPVEDTKILPALTGSEPPDILILSGGDSVKSYAQENLVDELSTVIKDGNIDLTDFYPAPMTQCQQGDKIYCLPWGTDLYALFWNKDLFEAAGLDPNTPPATMEQLAEYADKLTIVKDGVLEQVGFIPDSAWGHNDLYVHMFGGFWYNQDGTELTVNSQAMIDSYTWQQQFYSKYGYDNVLEFTTSSGDNYMTPDHPFYAGKLAMYVDGEWQTGANFISAIKPELNYGVAPFPPPADHPERANTIVNQGTVVVVPSGAKDKEASAKLLAWMMSPAIVAEEFCYNANLPTSKKAAEDPCFANISPKFKTFVDLMSSPNAFAVITTPITLELTDAMGQAEEKILHTGADPKTELDAVQAEYAQKLKDSLSP